MSTRTAGSDLANLTRASDREPMDRPHEVILAELRRRTSECEAVVAQYQLRIEDLEKLERHQLSQGLSADETRGELKAYRTMIQRLRELHDHQANRWERVTGGTEASL
ncbi:MAG TPA: hypothetical protein VK934_01105 [Fimbriimonas sp.]|nr:hypothetical protein [Fimbriimonas sp.]